MTITEEHIKASLISAVEDKLRRRIQERVNQHQAEIETLNRTRHELLEGRAKINDIISKLEREEVRIDWFYWWSFWSLCRLRIKILFVAFSERFKSKHYHSGGKRGIIEEIPGNIGKIRWNWCWWGRYDDSATLQTVRSQICCFCFLCYKTEYFAFISGCWMLMLKRLLLKIRFIILVKLYAMVFWIWKYFWSMCANYRADNSCCVQ